LQSRIRKVIAKLDAKKLDAFVALRNAHYLAGTTAATAVVVSGRGPVLICSRLEFARAKQESQIENIQVYSPYRVPIQRGERVHFCKLRWLIADVLRGVRAHDIGFDTLKSETLQKLRTAYKANYQEMPELIEKLRMIKSKQEIAWLRKSATIAVRGMRSAAELIKSGRSELEIAAEVEYEMRKAGSGGTPFTTIVASGRNSWLPHATATRKRLCKGELVVVDLGATHMGYASDMTRTCALAPTAKQAKLIDIVKSAQAAAIERVRDGVSARSVDNAARRLVSRAGYAKFYLHGTGHGVGLDVHELPSLAPNSKDILRKKMVTTVEPGLYVPGVGGARWEDMALVTAKGHELLTRGG